MSKLLVPSLPSDIFNLMKGGDFMGLEHDAERMMWEANPQPRVKNSRFPERVGRMRLNSALEIATTLNSTGNPEIDPVVFKSVSSMDGRE